MPIPASVQAYWSTFAAAVAGVSEADFYEAFSFGDSPAMADELAALVLSGRKRATAGAVWSYAASGQGLPRPGHLSVVTDAAGRPLCVIRTLQVDIVPFDEVTADFAAAEGEGDATLASWRREHRAYFTRECQRSGRSFDEQMLVACERFEVVYPPDGRSA